MVSNYQKLFFICHASEDKVPFVRDLVGELNRLGLKTFFDEYSIEKGEGITAKVNEGLSKSTHGVIVFSEAFLKKQWPKKEAEVLYQRSVDRGGCFIPIFLEIDVDKIRDEFPLYAEPNGYKSSEGAVAIGADLYRLSLKRPKVRYFDLGVIPIDFENGFSIHLSRLIVFQPSIDGCLLEWGEMTDEGFFLRLDIQGDRLVFEARDSGFHRCSVSVNIKDWASDSHAITITGSPGLSQISIFIDGVLRDRFATDTLSFSRKSGVTAHAFLGASLDLTSWHPLVMATPHVWGKYLTADEVVAAYRIFETYNLSMDKVR